ncbi:MAG: hypothetical protein ACTSXD_06820 [Candidatus Heimdallarchaeaceae archaeon]
MATANVTINTKPVDVLLGSVAMKFYNVTASNGGTLDVDFGTITGAFVSNETTDGTGIASKSGNTLTFTCTDNDVLNVLVIGV